MSRQQQTYLAALISWRGSKPITFPQSLCFSNTKLNYIKNNAGEKCLSNHRRAEPAFDLTISEALTTDWEGLTEGHFWESPSPAEKSYSLIA